MFTKHVPGLNEDEQTEVSKFLWFHQIHTRIKEYLTTNRRIYFIRTIQYDNKDLHCIIIIIHIWHYLIQSRVVVACCSRLIRQFINLIIHFAFSNDFLYFFLIEYILCSSGIIWNSNGEKICQFCSVLSNPFRYKHTHKYFFFEYKYR